MKYLKSYEKLNTIPGKIHPGDYVIMITFASNEKVKDFINNNVGQITKIDKKEQKVHVKYNFIPKNIQDLDFSFNFFDYDKVRIFHIQNLEYSSKYKNELEAIIAAKQFNI